MTIAGLPLPSTAAWFVVTIALHVAGGITAAVAGLLAIVTAKTSGRHARVGNVYYWGLALVSVTMVPLVISRWPTDNALGLLGIVAFISAFFGRRARRRAVTGWQCVHVPGMGISYIALLTAFYVDNGPHLPFWNRLPMIALWVLPSCVGLPVLAVAWWKHCPPRRLRRRPLLDTAT